MGKTLLLGLDSMTFTVLDDLVEEGRLPFFERCLREGVRADLISTPNPLTPPAWTSMITGQGPGKHGVYDFMHWSEHEFGPWGRLVTSNEVRCETLASMADRHGKRAIWLNFPLMFPAPRIKGFVVPGYITARQLRTSVYPRPLYDRMRALPDFDPKEFSWNMDENRRAVDGLPPEEYERWIGYYIKKDRHWFHVARMLITEEEW
ncbi:MAG: alkaline phosphatase family protein, partial [Deltaproteobacteria bacterium]|nr:alkaline phosphatase family protein [Deltaproteobacteria bacterium]